MKPARNILDIGIHMAVDLKYLSGELFRFLKGSEFYFWRISSEDIDEEFPLSILVYGRESIADDVVAAFFCNSGFTKTQLSQCPPSKASKVISTLKEERDSLVIRERPFWKRGNVEKEILFQTLLDTSIAIKARTFSEFMEQEIGSKTRKEVLSSVELCRQTRQTCELEEMLDFRSNLLIPTAKALHGEQASVPTVDELRRLGNKLTLFLIMTEGKTKAGSLAIHSEHHDNLTMWYMGMEENLLKDSKLKSQHHMHLFTLALKMACKLKIESLSPGVTYPIMNHGNLNYKLRFASRPLQLPYYPKCTLEFAGKRKAEILSRYPLLAINGNELYGLIGVTQPLPSESLERYFNSFFKKSCCKGLRTIKCFVQQDECSETFMDKLRRMNLHAYALQHAQVQEEHMILTFRRNT